VRYLIYFPNHIPVPAIGAWMYVVIPDSMHDDLGLEYHSVGVVRATVNCGNDTAVEYQGRHPEFANRPL